jgi:hypothetical protein
MPKPGPIERVLVRLDAASENGTAIDTAARLAVHAQAALHGIFVEDEDLLHLARLPFARQITLGAAAENLTTEHVELHLRVAVERTRQELLAVARRHGVDGSFEVVRGAAETATFGASERDLVVAGDQTRPIGRHFRVACRWWSAIEATPGPVLLVRHDWGVSGTVVVLLRDRGAAAVRLLDAAARIAQAADRVLTVIGPPAVTGAGHFERWLADQRVDPPARLQIEVAPAEPAALYRRIGELDCRLLAVEAGPAEGSDERLRAFVEGFGCDILFVR